MACAVAIPCLRKNSLAKTLEDSIWVASREGLKIGRFRLWNVPQTESPDLRTFAAGDPDRVFQGLRQGVLPKAWNRHGTGHRLCQPIGSRGRDRALRLSGDPESGRPGGGEGSSRDRVKAGGRPRAH